MRSLTTGFLLAAVLAVALTAPSLYAQNAEQPSGSMMDHGMMGDKNKKGERGMMGSMKQMKDMMDHCNRMMSEERPNQQWQKKGPSQPDDKKG